MKGLKKLREVAGLSQFDLAHRTGISRARLQLIEAQHTTIRREEVEAVNRALRSAMERQVVMLQNTLSASGPLAAGA